MSGYLLDNTALVDFSKGVEPVRSRILRLLTQGERLGVTPVTVTEFHSGTLLGQDPDWDRFMRGLEYWSISFNAAVRAGYFRYVWLRHGVQLSVPDALLAAVAEERDAILLTDDLRGFPMAEVRTERLRTP